MTVRCQILSHLPICHLNNNKHPKSCHPLLNYDDLAGFVCGFQTEEGGGTIFRGSIDREGDNPGVVEQDITVNQSQYNGASKSSF